MNHHLIPQLIRQELVDAHGLQLGSMASGGLSGAWIWRAHSPHGPVALRGWPAAHPNPQRLTQIHCAMRTARQLGMENVPRIFVNRQGASFTSDGQRLWELTQWMPGAADYAQSPTRRRLESALQALAKLHVAWQAASSLAPPILGPDCGPILGQPSAASLKSISAVTATSLPAAAVGPSPTVAERRQRLTFGLQHQQAWRNRVRGNTALGNTLRTGTLRAGTLRAGTLRAGTLRTGGVSPGPWGAVSLIDDSQSDAAAMLSLAQQTLVHLSALGPQLLQRLVDIQATEVPLHFVLRDVWSDHILFTDDEVTGIIDFGAARVDEPATDVARLLGSLEPLDPARWLVGWQAYHAVNPDVDLERVQLLDGVGTLLAAVQWLQWLVIEPRQFDAPLRQLIVRWQRLLQRLEASW